MVARVADKTLLDRWGSPENVVETVQFLIKNDYITGEFITVDGGERHGHRKYEAG
jgi:NAD(P)-dependent dehydrogenase (short-subunit alcohol dehydrogenase family)